MCLNIEKKQSDAQTVVALGGRLDTATAPELENQLKELFPTTSDLVLDFAALDYISSAGLRVLLVAQKQMNKTGGKMTLINVNDVVQEVLEMTGFVDILNIC